MLQINAIQNCCFSYLRYFIQYLSLLYIVCIIAPIGAVVFQLLVVSYIYKKKNTRTTTIDSIVLSFFFAWFLCIRYDDIKFLCTWNE